MVAFAIVILPAMSEGNIKNRTESYHVEEPSDSLDKIALYIKYSEIFNVNFCGTEDLNMLREMSEWLGTPYKYALSKKGCGTDCSGFVTGVYRNVFNIKLQRSSSMIIHDVDRVKTQELQFGDILFFRHLDRYHRIFHVGIYLGDNKFVHSDNSKRPGVKVENMSAPYYHKRFYCGGRVKSVAK